MLFTINDNPPLARKAYTSRHIQETLGQVSWRKFALRASFEDFTGPSGLLGKAGVLHLFQDHVQREGYEPQVNAGDL